MIREFPDHHDAELTLRAYELRREPLMREARKSIAGFLPRSADEVIAVTKADHPLNAAWRQTSTYWEMVYAMARYGILNPDFLMESCAEGMLLFAKVEPHLPELRKVTNPRLFRNAEWVAANSSLAKEILTGYRERLQKQLAAKT